MRVQWFCLLVLMKKTNCKKTDIIILAINNRKEKNMNKSKSAVQNQLNGTDIAKLFRSQKEYLVYNQRLYLFYKELRCFIHLKRPELVPNLLKVIPAKERDAISNSSLEDAAKRLYRDFEHHRNLNELAIRGQFLLNLRNGVYDLNQGKLISGEEAVSLAKEMCFTYALDFSYIEGASLDKAPVFRRFLETSLEVTACAEKQALLLEIIGICISSVQIARKFYFFVGATKSGKSVIADLLHRIVHPELAVTAFGLNQLSGRFNVQHLEYSRLNLCRELTAGKVTGTDTLKMLVSDEPMFVEGKGKEGYVAHIHTKLLTCANQMPNFGEMDAAGNKSMTDRMVVLRFNRTISEEEMDRHLLDKLFEERDVILSMAVDALKALHDRDYIFTVPDDTKELMESYVQESRSLELFLEERCELTGKVHLSAFISAYKEFCAENALSPYKNKEISAYIANSLPAVHKEKFRQGGKYLWGWNGLSLKQEEFGLINKEE